MLGSMEPIESLDMESEPTPNQAPSLRSLTVTVCELHDGAALAQDWSHLIRFAREQGSDLVLLPEMPFYSLLTQTPHFDQQSWDAAVDAHDRWEARLEELRPAAVMGTRPIDFGNERYDQGFVWSAAEGMRSAHAQALLQCQDGAWEARWYHSAPPEFVPIRAGAVMVGFAIGSELWALEATRAYRSEAVDLLVMPRKSVTPDRDRWLSAAREAAVSRGAYALSSGRSEATSAAGGGWVVAPDGEVLATTSAGQPFVSVRLDLTRTARRCSERADPETIRPI